MRSLNAAGPQFPGDDGAADPAVLAALAAYAAGRGSEHAALNALASSRLLVPVVAVLTEEASGDSEPAPDGLRQEKSTELALPTLVGRDGRAAVLAFTSLAALTKWRPDARPVAVPAARAWQAGTEEASAVVIDVAGPVPVTVEGARLAALAAGRPAPLPHQDPDVLAALHAALGGEPLIVQASLTTPDQRAGCAHRGSGAHQDSPAGGRADQQAATPTGSGGTSDTEDSAARDVSPDGAAPDGAAGGTAPDGAAGGTAPDGAAGGTAPDGAAEDTADLALQVTLADACDPAAATAAVRRVAEALLTATGGRLRRGMEVSVAPARAR